MHPKTIELFFTALDNFAEQNAFCIDNIFYTYGDFKTRIKGIQNKLIELNTGKVIGVFVDNSIESYASILAIWLSGHVYVPLNPNNPSLRNNKVIKSANMSSVLTSKEEYTSSIESNITIINTYNCKLEGELQLGDISSSELAYILFTSGSTGEPKGVQISWANFDAMLESYFCLDISLDSNDRVLQMFDLSFDGSIISFAPALCVGACSYTISTSGVKYMNVFEVMEDYDLTVGLIVPSVISFLKPYFDEINFKSFKYCFVGAEASYNNILAKWQSCIPNAKIFNLYGPTESTVFCLSYYFNDQLHNKSNNGVLCLGKPVVNMEVEIIDAKSNLFLEANQKGEIVISGKQLTSGYLNNPEKNNLAFFYKENNSIKEKWYKTGDCGYFDSEGDFFYCGRTDNQVQIQGYRIELSEIEHPVRKQFKIDVLVAVENMDENNNSEIVLFVENYNGDTKKIMDYLKASIPSYMVPSQIKGLSIFPLTSNGKIDRKELLNLLAD